MEKELKILLVEDNPGDARLLEEVLVEAPGTRFDLEWESSLTGAFGRLPGDFDLVLLDLGLPESSGLETLKKVLERVDDLPVIVLTGLKDEEAGAAAVREGAQDYIVKGQYDGLLLSRAVRYAIERKAAQNALERSEELYRTLIETSPDAITMTDLTGKIIYSSPKTIEMHGYESEDEVLGMSALDFIVPQEREKALGNLVKTLEEGSVKELEYELLRKDGTTFLGEMNAALVRDSNGEPSAFIATTRDVSDERKLERELAEERAFTELALDSIKDCFYVLDPPSARFVRWNRRVEEVSGYSGTELAEMSVFDFLEPEDREGQMDFYRDMVENGSATTEVHALTREGKRIPFETFGTLLRNEYGSPRAVVALARDITERKEAEEALKASEKRFRAIVQDQSELICRYLPDGRLTFVNDAFCRYLGVTRDYLIGTRAEHLILRHEREEALQHMHTLRPDDPVVTVEHRITLRDGEQRWQNWTHHAIYDDSGTLIEYQSVGRDVTLRRRAEEELRMVNAELEGYAHTVSHDLKSPLGAIGVASETLRYLSETPDKLTELNAGEIRDLTGIIRDNVRRAQNLIQDILQLAEAGTSVDEQTVVEVRNIVRRVLEERTSQIEERGVEVEVEDELGSLVADPTHVYQLFANLIGNAINHNDSSMPKILIKRLSANGEKRVRYLVKDNGRGIPDEIREDIFTPFTKGTSGGTGIGLAIVGKIVKLYKGEITAYNDNGACFEFTLRSPAMGS